MSTTQGPLSGEKPAPLWLYIRSKNADELVICFEIPLSAQRRPTDVIQNLIRRAVGEVYSKQFTANRPTDLDWEINPATLGITVHLGTNTANTNAVIADIRAKLDTLLDEAGTGISTNIAP